MELKKMTQKEFASELCVSEGTLSSIYTGRTKPTNNMVSAIHECFPEVNISWLMFGEGDMIAEPESGRSNDDDSAGRASVPTQQMYGQDLFSAASLVMQNTPQVKEVVKMIDKPQRRITEIRVFYDDGTFETFTA